MVFISHYMKKHCLIVFFLFMAIAWITAQNTPAIIKELNTQRSGQGTVVVYQDESIEGLIGSKIVSGGSYIPSEGNGEPSRYIQTKGYKIQIYSGSSQKLSKNEANSRKAAIRNVFPTMEVTITFNSPVWRALAGNYKTYEQATEALKELKSAFPAFAREMQIKESIIKLPVY